MPGVVGCIDGYRCHDEEEFVFLNKVRTENCKKLKKISPPFGRLR